MPQTDAKRWNARYGQERFPNFEQPRPFLVENAALLPETGLALDLAMGLGGNAGFLLERGLRVIGLDISEVALRHARSRHPQIQAAVVDLTQIWLPPSRFDLILNFYYLQRDLWPAIAAALRPEGILVYETLTLDMLSTRPEIEPQYLLAPGELRRAFPCLQILVYHEGRAERGADRSKAVAGLIARKSDRNSKK